MAYAFVKLAEQRGFDEHLVEQLVKALAGENEQLKQKLGKLISEGPAPLIVIEKKL